MRSAMLLVIAAYCCVVASAGWIHRFIGDDGQPSWVSRETGVVQFVGWTPKPTPAPETKPTESERVLDLLLKREKAITADDWTNSVTCGWMSGVSSSPWTCGDNSTCATNDDHIVACVSETLSEFYSVCLDYEAYQANYCENDAVGTGCCTSTAYGACATYLWTGSPTRSMYRCAISSTIISMLDVPQFVVDASLSSQTTVTSPSGAGTTDSTNGASDPSTFTGSSGHQLGQSDKTADIIIDRLAAIVACSVIGGLVAIGIIFRLLVVRCLRQRQPRAGAGDLGQQDPSPSPSPSLQDQVDPATQNQMMTRGRGGNLDNFIPEAPPELEPDLRRAADANFYSPRACVFVRDAAYDAVHARWPLSMHDYTATPVPPPSYSQLFGYSHPYTGQDTPPAASSGGSTPGASDNIELNPLPSAVASSGETTDSK
ncbi:hypothetical protein F4821DRAFT_141194 [Hypoxylon rubiginosum]|uniref:Uncharacterized protein n=1 Tax=Hypoxylon rubiginosum TaxID=110542 RepID=A0ACC0CZJ1_9PEZI|nr:hypothetical protein F4821DRAFT_141194 [Hypoxylon rubiginosum]